MRRTVVDVRSNLSREHRAFLDGLPVKNAQFSGWTMKNEDPPDDEDEDGEDEDEDEDEPLELEPDQQIKVGNKVLKVADIQRIAAKQKREGKRSGQAAVLRELGFETVEAARAAIAAAPKPKKKADDDDQDDEASRRVADAEARAAERERKAAEKERRSDIRGILREFGVAREDLDDVEVLVDRELDKDYDEDDLEEAVEAVKARRKSFFEHADDEDEGESTKPKTRTRLPVGRPKSKNKGSAKPFGAAGIERAKQKGWVSTGS